MPLKFGIKLIIKAIEEKQRQLCWEIWLVKYPTMDKDDFITFEDFYNQGKVNEISQVDKDELLKRNDEIIKKIQNGNFKVISNGNI